MNLCDSSRPGDSQAGYYLLPYIEATEGKRHGYRTKHNGIQWTRSADHPEDPKCPACAANRATRAELTRRLIEVEGIPPEDAAGLINLAEATGRDLNRTMHRIRAERLTDLAELAEQVGCARATRDDYGGAYAAWQRADRIRSEANRR